MASIQTGVETGSSDVSRQRTNKTDKRRRSWSIREEHVLLFALKELVAQGWKSDNGFRAGFLGKLEDALRKEFPGTDLKATPHINSKLGTWKKNYYSLTQILRFSGTGFNPDQTIDCSNDQWELFLRKDPNASNMRLKSWPYFEDWKEIFGKDSATGDRAADLMDAVIHMTSRDNLARDVDADHHGQNVPVEDEIDTDAAEDSVCQREKVGDRPRAPTKKRKQQDESIDRVYELLVELGRNTDQRLEHIGNRIGYEFDLCKARTEVYENLKALPDLSKRERFEVCEILCNKVEKLELFMSLPNEARSDYLLHVFETRGQ